jgi:1-acyl-sn-glycerol-3-phosphate acyltransferase
VAEAPGRRRTGEAGQAVAEGGGKRSGPLNKLWRAFATGVCFSVFGLAQLVEAALVMPFLLLIRDRARRRRAGQRLMRWSFTWFADFMRFMGVLTYETRNLERLNRPGLLVLANHPTLIDIVFLISFLREANCIVKGGVYKNPFMRFAVGAAGLIPNSGGEELVERCADSLAEGGSLVIFPEGSRSEVDRLLDFQRGAAHVAVRSARDITPVVIHVSPHNLGRRSSWWRVPPCCIHFVFDVKEDIPVRPFLERQPERPRAARELTAFLSQYFNHEVEQSWRDLKQLSAS